MKSIYTIFFTAILGSMYSCNAPSTTAPKNEAVAVSDNQSWKYLEALDSIAKANNNNRFVGSPGGIATKDYIIEHIKSLGYEYSVQSFTNRSGHKGNNIIIDIKGKSDQIIMLGAHYDSVEFGPGINDNGTGVAILLELMRQIKQLEQGVAHNVRIAFWDSEENGVEGSRYYVDQLTAQEKAPIQYYINVDMVGTKGAKILLLDGDASSYEAMKKTFSESGNMSEQEVNDMIANLKAGYPQQTENALALENKVRALLDKHKISYTEDYLLSLSSDVFPFVGWTAVTGYSIY